MLSCDNSGNVICPVPCNQHFLLTARPMSATQRAVEQKVFSIIPASTLMEEDEDGSDRKNFYRA